MSYVDDISDSLTEDGRRHDEEYARARREEPSKLRPAYDPEGWHVSVLSLGEYALFACGNREPRLLLQYRGPFIELTEPLADRPDLRVAWVAEIDAWLAAHRDLEQSKDPIDQALVIGAKRALEILGSAPAEAATSTPAQAASVGATRSKRRSK